MLNRYNVNFDNMVWNNLRSSIRNRDKAGIWYRFLNVLFAFLGNNIIPIVNYLYSQIFLEHADFDSLKQIARQYRLYPKAGESVEDFRNRVKIKRSLLHTPPSVSLIKRIFRVYAGVECEIIQSITMDNVFVVGVTPLGTGKCVSSNYLRFTWLAILPDLSASDIDRNYIIDQINEYSPSNEFFIYEDRPGGYYQW